MKNQRQSLLIPKLAILSGVLALLCLVALHFLSPEFDPSWRMVSEYALGKYKALVTFFFIFWGLSSILTAVALWKYATRLPARIGVVLLFISGIGAMLASYYDVSQVTGHGVAGMLGIPTVPIATLLIGYHFVKKENWKEHKSSILFLSHSTWIILVLMVVSMVIMISSFQNAGIEMKPDTPVPTAVPDGVIAIVGYVNRLLILADVLWLILISRIFYKTQLNNF